MTENERKLNEALQRAHEDYERLSERLAQRSEREIAATRLLIVDLLYEFAKKDNTISKSRLNSLLREVERVEQELREVTQESVIAAMEESAEVAYEDAFAAFQRAVGVSAEFVLTARVAESAILPTLTGRKPTPRNLATYLAERTGPDGLQLSDRVWQFAGDQREEINRVLRAGIIRGDTTAKMVREVRAVYRTEAWKARRLVLTEANVAYRTAIGYTAERSKFVRALRLIPGIHRSESCVETAKENRHGLGRGIFLPSDTDIFNIHPNCTSYTQYILNEEVR